MRLLSFSSQQTACSHPSLWNLVDRILSDQLQLIQLDFCVPIICFLSSRVFCWLTGASERILIHSCNIYLSSKSFFPLPLFQLFILILNYVLVCVHDTSSLKRFFKDLLICTWHVYVFCLQGCLCITCKLGPEKAPDTLELDLWITVSQYVDIRKETQDLCMSSQCS
jgi:hypothetical protein